MAEEKNLKFFITHSWRDNEFAQRLCDDLRARGYGGFLDIYSVKAGDDIPREINRGLEECDVYIPVLSFESLKSKWCEREINAALMLSVEPERNGRPNIVPVLAEDCRSVLPPLLRPLRYINFAGRYAQALDELQKAFVTRRVELEPAREAFRSKLPPSEVEHLYSEGIHALLSGRWEQSVLAFRHVLALDPYFRDAYLRLKEAERQLALSVAARERAQLDHIEMPKRIRHIIETQGAFISLIIGFVACIGIWLAFPQVQYLVGLFSDPTRVAMRDLTSTPQTKVIPTPTGITTPIEIPRPTGTLTPVPTITETLLPPRATATPTKKPAVATTPTISALPGVYVLKLETDPPKIDMGDGSQKPQVGFTMTLLNTTGGVQTFTKWFVRVFQDPEQTTGDNAYKNSYGESFKFDITVGTGTVEATTPPHIVFGPGRCDYVAIPYYTTENNQAVPFLKTNGQPLYYAFKVCQ